MKLIYLHKVVYRAVLLTASGETITIAKRDRKGGAMHCGKYCNRRGNTTSNKQIKYNTNIILSTWLSQLMQSRGVGFFECSEKWKAMPKPVM